MVVEPQVYLVGLVLAIVCALQEAFATLVHPDSKARRSGP